MKLTKKAFKDVLNRVYPDPSYKNGKYHQSTRPYGDYLYSQDKDQFDMLFEEWKELHNSKKDTTS